MALCSFLRERQFDFYFVQSARFKAIAPIGTGARDRWQQHSNVLSDEKRERNQNKEKKHSFFRSHFDINTYLLMHGGMSPMGISLRLMSKFRDEKPYTWAIRRRRLLHVCSRVRTSLLASADLAWKFLPR